MHGSNSFYIDDLTGQLLTFCRLIACEQGEGKERGRGKREPVGMAKDFDFQMPVIYVIFKLTIQVASTIETTNVA